MEKCYYYSTLIHETKDVQNKSYVHETEKNAKYAKVVKS